ncbi:MAG: AAA family ATPase, partial [Candidatus Eremiobacterota bacterium]
MSRRPRAAHLVCDQCSGVVVVEAGSQSGVCEQCQNVVTLDSGLRGEALIRRYVGSLSNSSPRELYGRLEELGYRGQDRARRAVCLAAYRHIRRLQRIYLDQEDRLRIPVKPNSLLMGPTGCGKTFLIELLFREILKIPTVVVDVTNYSETGYIGEDTRTILTRLVYAADGVPELASCGVVALDEFDKLASSSNTARFAGEGTTKDVSGFGVQRELLAMLEGSDVLVPLDFGYSHYGSRVSLPTRDITFFACGAFSGYSELHFKRTRGEQLGFRNRPERRFKEGVAYLLEEQDAQDIESFQAFGFIPELIARFTRIVPFEPLDRDTLRAILVDNVLSRFVSEFHGEGIELTVEPRVLDALVAACLKRQTGARGLHAGLTRALEDAAFDSFRQDGVSRVL